jgi:hypothetical protein
MASYLGEMCHMELMAVLAVPEKLGVELVLAIVRRFVWLVWFENLLKIHRIYRRLSAADVQPWRDRVIDPHVA